MQHCSILFEHNMQKRVLFIKSCCTYLCFYTSKHKISKQKQKENISRSMIYPLIGQSILYMQWLRSVDKISSNLLAHVLFETNQIFFFLKNLYSFCLFGRIQSLYMGLIWSLWQSYMPWVVDSFSCYTINRGRFHNISYLSFFQLPLGYFNFKGNESSDLNYMGHQLLFLILGFLCLLSWNLRNTTW